MRLAQSGYGLSDGIQSEGECAPFLAKIRKGGSAAPEESYGLMFQQMEKTPHQEEDCQKLLVVDQKL